MCLDQQIYIKRRQSTNREHTNGVTTTDCAIKSRMAITGITTKAIIITVIII